MIVVQELGMLLNCLGSTREPFKDLDDISSILHRDNAKLIFLINPDKESLVIIMEDSTAPGPIAVQTASI